MGYPFVYELAVVGNDPTATIFRKLERDGLFIFIFIFIFYC